MRKQASQRWRHLKHERRHVQVVAELLPCMDRRCNLRGATLLRRMARQESRATQVRHRAKWEGNDGRRKSPGMHDVKLHPLVRRPFQLIPEQLLLVEVLESQLDRADCGAEPSPVTAVLCAKSPPRAAGTAAARRTCGE